MEAYQNKPNPQDEKSKPLFKVGDVVSNREGRPNRILCTDAKGDQPIVALSLSLCGEYEQERRFCANGSYSLHHIGHAFDLVPNPIPKEKIVSNLFKVGDVVKSREGNSVRIICTDAATSQPIVGLECDSSDGDESTENYHEDGSYRIDRSKDDRDLMPPKIVRYINVYGDPTLRCRADADHAAASERVACLRIEYHPGQMDD